MLHFFYNSSVVPETIRTRYRRMTGADKSRPTALYEADARSVGNEFLRFYCRTLDLALTYTKGKVPAGVLNGSLAFQVAGLFGQVGQAIEEQRIADALDTLEAMSERVNAWLDEALKTNAPIHQIVYNAVQLAVNLALLYEPFLPATAANIRSHLGYGTGWQFSSVPSGASLKSNIL